MYFIYQTSMIGTAHACTCLTSKGALRQSGIGPSHKEVALGIRAAEGKQCIVDCGP